MQASVGSVKMARIEAQEPAENIEKIWEIRTKEIQKGDLR